MTRPTPEDAWQRQLVDLAAMLGYHWLHLRPGLRQSGAYSVPVQGTLGRGWPDLFLVRERDRRFIFVELKAANGRLTDDQQRVLAILRDAGAEVYVWRPADIDTAYAVLDGQSPRSPDESLPARPAPGASDPPGGRRLASSGPLPVSGAGAGRSTTEDMP